MHQVFLLGGHSFDQRSTTCVYYWLAGVPCEMLQLGFQTFGFEEAAMLYFPTIDAHRRAQTLLQTRGIEVFEADFRLHDRYLMERFARGGLYFEGVAGAKDGYTEYRNVHLKGAEVQPDFKVVSLDVEYSGQGELYSIGLYGHNSWVNRGATAQSEQLPPQGG
ncbi:hypothetical protein [Microbulbifer sp. Q7]|uniref:hypothetical protein n=1 Tax=Microbulbifer sp. Q7 TaxID=1785091 RepID=UPI00083059AA|nr:hypothetical protein [Microbulbifer sp. Q7]